MYCMPKLIYCQPRKVNFLTNKSITFMKLTNPHLYEFYNNEHTISVCSKKSSTHEPSIKIYEHTH
jgi:hypothetical protein